MTRKRWGQIKAVLGDALEKSESQRSQFVEQACHSESWLRRAVKRLLAGHDPRTLESPVAGVLGAVAEAELEPGRRLGQYRLELKLGQGGMGVVYKAWDERLCRPVALKVLPPWHVQDSAGRLGFLREARAASGLNHPNIVTVYEVGSQDGVDFITMEYVEGRRLDRLIPAGGLPLGKALEYGLAIASAVAKAHRSGIVHGDLKPANIMVTGEEVVKLLDFGLARRVRFPNGESELSTQEGRIMGTPGYMSPEQAAGKRADERSDIFCFGAVLYQMLSGRPAFTGESPAARLAAVLTTEPAPLGESPAGLGKLVALCLHKDPEHRLQHMDDVRSLLADFLETAPQFNARERRGRLLRVVASAAALTCICFALWFGYRSIKSPSAGMRVVPLTSFRGTETYPSFSPDGRQIAFAWNGESEENYDIYVQVVGTAAPPLRLTSNALPDLNPVWSPDGRQIAFVRQGGLYVISPLGGPERRLCDVRFPHRPLRYSETLSWSPDSKWLAISDGPEQGPWTISLISAEQGDIHSVFSSSAVPHFPTFSPDGRYLAYASCPSVFGACDLNLLEVGPDASVRGLPRRLTRQKSYILGLTWTPDSRSIVYGAAPCPFGLSSLWRIGVPGGGAPVRIDVAELGAESPTISRAGDRLSYVRRSGDLDVWRFQIGSASAVPIIASTFEDANAQFSPDGKKIAFDSSRAGGCPEIWLSDADGSNIIQLTNAKDAYQGTPRWSPDGRWISFDRLGEDGHSDVFVMQSDGTQTRRLTPFSSDESVSSWSRDGKWIYFRSNRSGKHQIWKMPFQGGQPVQVTDEGGNVVFESWDGKTLYYLKTGSILGGPLFARSMDGGPEEVIVSDRVVARAFFPAQDGIYYIASQKKGSGLHVLKHHDPSTGRCEVLRTMKENLGLGLAVSPDRKTVLFTAGPKFGADLMLIENFR